MEEGMASAQGSNSGSVLQLPLGSNKGEWEG